ncbi:ABC transporter permease subunit [Mycoplasma miroungirhinis]|uniref:ABC transporter permease subunit n=1 Tax=Mycoplasma miroungirhinis TaxID=754516 RepID=A0A6M4JCZ3_9MOLU|nr:ABC transporter permease subunit [Mycoplasma miroungirhinis]QJR43947.1 ABC transporter permease subunit [Mycoplasma miroungirhinis]
MSKYILQRIAFAIVTLFIISLFSYVLIATFSTANPFREIAVNTKVPNVEAFVKQKEQEFGWDKNVLTQYFIYIGKFLSGDFGFVFNSQNNPFGGEITTMPQLFFKPLQYSIMISLPAFIISSIIGIILGTFAGYKRGTLLDSGINIFVLIFIALPSFIIAPIAINIAINSGLPSTVFKQGDGQPLNVIIKSYITPIFVVTLGSLAGYTSYTRNQVITVLTSNYVLIAKTKGLSNFEIFKKYVFRNISIPIFSIVFPSYIVLLTGSIIVEVYWNVPGTSQIIARAFPSGERNVVMFSTLFFTFLSIITEIIIDISYAILDPRIKYSSSSGKNRLAYISAYIERKRLQKSLFQANTLLDKEVTNASSEFNNRYNLGTNLQEKIKYVENPDSLYSSNIAGKPKKMLVEIAKRFFKNPYVTLAFITFIVLLLCSIIIPIATHYSPNKPINNIDKEFITLLPPQYTNTKSIFLKNNNRIFETFIKIKELVDKHPELQTYFQPLLDTFKVHELVGASKSFSVTYNPFIVFDSYLLNIEIQKILDVDPNHTFNPEFIASLRATFPAVSTLLGTDINGFDIWTTSWAATAESIKIALIVATLQTLIGVAIGAYLGFHVGKWIDTIFMRIIEIFLAPPSLIWLLLFVSIMGVSNTALIIALVVTGWAWPVSRTRMFIITVKDEEYITAAKSIGASTSRQVFTHALPAIIGKIATGFVQRIPGIILSIASLAFLGFYKNIDNANLGQLLLDATPQAPDNFWILLLPSLILLTLSLSLQFIALGVHDALDPKVIKASKK